MRTGVLSFFVVLSVAACGSSSTSVSDAGTDGSSGGIGSGEAGTDAGGGGGGDAGGDFSSCMRQSDLDSDCMSKYGASASAGWSCTNVFTTPPPCQPLDTRGCTEICENRCCPP